MLWIDEALEGSWITAILKENEKIKTALELLLDDTAHTGYAIFQKPVEVQLLGSNAV